MLNNKMEYLDLRVLKKGLRIVVLPSPPTALKQYLCWLDAIHSIVTAMGWTSVLPKFLCGNPNLQGIRKWGVWEVVRLRRKNLIDGISALTKETQESSLTPTAVRGYRKETAIWEVSSHQISTESAGAWSWPWPSQPSEPWDISVCCFLASQSLALR